MNTFRRPPGSGFHLAIVLCAGATLLAAAPPSAHAQAKLPVFTRANTPGFGDFQNSYSWSMAWFQGKLYVGTARNIQCVEKETEQTGFPHLKIYPPAGDCPICTTDPYDLNLQAEIWAYTPSTKTWARVFQSPNNLPNPKEAGKFVAPDIGFRDMIVFTEADGTQALYVAGVTAREYLPGLPTPRLLRTTDGVTFTPVPLNIPNAPAIWMGLRAMVSYKGSLFMTGSVELTGEGFVAQSSNPASGNFQIVTVPSFLAYELGVFNNFLYIGAADFKNGYSLWKTTATGTPPYALTPVVTKGAGRGTTMVSVVSMHTFKNQLYVGSAGWDTVLAPCEMIRVNANDTWDVVVGNPRLDPVTHRMKFPVSGLPDGFGNPFNAHIWRIDDFNGYLYAGTNDASLAYAKLVPYFPAIATRYGFDLYSSKDGVYWNVNTTTGFGSPTSFGARTMASTPIGFFVGSANSCIGTEVFFTPMPGVQTSARMLESNAVASRSMKASPSATTTARPLARPPAELRGELLDGVTVLSWEPKSNAVSYKVTRTTLMPAPRTIKERTGALPAPLFIPGPAHEIGSSPHPYFRDPSGADDTQYFYYVQAVDGSGGLSAPSNVAIVSGSSESGTTFGALFDCMRGLDRAIEGRADAVQNLKELASQSRSAAARSDWTAAREALCTIQNRLAEPNGAPLDAADAQSLALRAANLSRRIHLVEEGVLPRHALDPP
jgi:hypothetical protein